MNVKILIAPLFLISFSAFSENLCPVNENVEPDMRISEAYFSKTHADAALKKLQGIVDARDKKYEWITVPNALKVIEGYVLRRDALENKDSVSGYHKSAFCDFMGTSAWWYD